MSETNPKPAKSVSMRKKAPASADLAPRPAVALYAVIAIAGAALMGVVASATLYSQKSWLYSTIHKNLIKDNPKTGKKNHKTAAELVHTAHQNVASTQKGAVIGAFVVLIALGFIGYGVYRGRHWSRWGTIAVWFVASFTGTVIGIGSVMGVAANVPMVYKLPSFLAGALMLVAVVLTNLPKATQWFALSKPVPAAGAPARRGLFAPRPAATPAANRAAATRDNRPAKAEAVDRSRTKKRTNAASVARGAELARTRAKAASKSRRTEA